MTGRRALRIGFWLVVAIAAVLIVRAIVDDDSTTTTSGAEIVTLDELRDSASSEGQPIYWAGEQVGTELELSRPEQGRTYVRYLADGAKVGTGQSRFLTVGTYSFPDAAKALRDLGRKPGGVIASAPGGGVIYFSRSRPQNVYLAYPDTDFQIEVFDPDPKRALSLVASGQIVPAG